MKKIKIKSQTLPGMEGKTVQEVYDFLKVTYPNKLALDGVDFYDNEALKDGNYHFFFGSVFRYSDGNWCVPYVRWFGSSFNRYGRWLGNDWDSNYRVVFLETELVLDSVVLTLESLNLRLERVEKKLKRLQ